MSKFASANSGGGGGGSFGGFATSFKKASNQLTKGNQKFGSNLTVGNSDGDEKVPQKRSSTKNTYQKIKTKRFSTKMEDSSGPGTGSESEGA
jgi:hypothetical protein